MNKILKTTIRVDMEVWKVIKDNRENVNETMNNSLRRLLKMKKVE